FAGYSVVVIRELVSESAQHLGEHVANVGFEAILALGIALGCEIEQRPAETPEVARAVIHREIHRSVGRALMRRRLAIQVARAVGLETERNIIEETVDARVVDEQAIARKIPGSDGLDAEHIAAIDDGP